MIHVGPREVLTPTEATLEDNLLKLLTAIWGFPSSPSRHRAEHCICNYLSLILTMGNLCSKASNQSDPFSHPGRVLGTSATNETPSRVPAPATVGYQHPGNTISEQEPSGKVENSDARNKAAEAAQVSSYYRSNKQHGANIPSQFQKRATASSSSNKGRLGKDLLAQRSKTRKDLLEDASFDARSEQPNPFSQWD
jgi:hypothetical protein